MSFFKKYSIFPSIEQKNTDSNEWRIVSTHLFEKILSGDRVQLTINDKTYFGTFKFYLHSIPEVALTVNGQEILLYIDKNVITSCFLAIKDDGFFRRMPISIQRLTNNPNDFNKKI